MTRIGIIGGGHGAALHAQAALLCDRVELVGVGGGSSSAAELAAAAEVPDLSFDALLDRCDAVVVAVPPASAPEVVDALAGRVRAVLVEAPVPADLPDPGCPAMIGANLLHAPAVRRAMRIIGDMASPHHLVMRSTQPAPTWGSHGSHAFGGAGLDPGARLAPILFAATGEAIDSAAARITEGPVAGVEESATITLALPSGRAARLESRWAPGSARAELEVASDEGVALVSFFPEPELELNGVPMAVGQGHPLVDLGFVAQLERLAGLPGRSGTPWLDLATGKAICGVLSSAIVAARRAFG